MSQPALSHHFVSRSPRRVPRRRGPGLAIAAVAVVLSAAGWLIWPECHYSVGELRFDHASTLLLDCRASEDGRLSASARLLVGVIRRGVLALRAQQSDPQIGGQCTEQLSHLRAVALGTEIVLARKIKLAGWGSLLDDLETGHWSSRQHAATEIADAVEAALATHHAARWSECGTQLRRTLLAQSGRLQRLFR